MLGRRGTPLLCLALIPLVAADVRSRIRSGLVRGEVRGENNLHLTLAIIHLLTAAARGLAKVQEKFAFVCVVGYFGLMLPSELVRACGFGSEAAVTVQDNKLVVTASRSVPREGWAEALQAIPQEELDKDHTELQSSRETPHDWGTNGFLDHYRQMSKCCLLEELAAKAAMGESLRPDPCITFVAFTPPH